MKHRLYEIPPRHFRVLIKHLGFTTKMVNALTLRYESDCSHSRPSVCFVNGVSEHGLMKAEKRVLTAHKDFLNVYSHEV